MTAAAPPPWAWPVRRVACLLAALCLGLSPGTVRAGDGAPPAVTDLVCGAFVREPAPGEAWPAPRDVRPGEAVEASDRGLGCRFVVSGQAGQAPVAVAVRLTRPLPEGGTAQDAWQAAARPGEPAVAAYALAAGLPVAAGEWTLALTPPGGQPATARFQVAGRPAETGPPPPVPQTAPSAKAAKTASAAPRPEPALAAAAPQARPAAPEPAPSAASAAPPAPTEPNGPSAPPVAPAPAAAQPSRPPAAAASAAKPEPSAAAKALAPRPGKDAPASKALPAAGYLALQTGLFADADNAAAQAAKLRSQGLPACLAVSDQGGKRRYRVLAGRFGDRRAAAAARAEVAAVTGVAPLVTPVAASDIPGLRCR